MKKNLTRIICLVLVLLLVLSAIPALAVSAAAADANELADIVLVLDCSGSLFDNDPDELCIEACKAFVDTLPASKEVRVSLLTIGYMSKDVYNPKNEQFKDWFIPTGSEFEFTHLNVPLGQLNSTEDRDNFKNAVLAAVDKAKNTSVSNTSIGASLAAAVDILETNGTKSENGCIIFVSDGIDAPYHSFYKEEMPKMINYAKEKAYSTYCVQLAYGNSGTAEPRRERQACSPVWCTVLTAVRRCTTAPPRILKSGRISSSVLFTTSIRKTVKPISSVPWFWRKWCGSTWRLSCPMFSGMRIIFAKSSRRNYSWRVKKRSGRSGSSLRKHRSELQTLTDCLSGSTRTTLAES